MRPRVAIAGLLATVLAACATSPAPPGIAYVPPSTEPATIGSAHVAQPADLIWSQLLDLLEQSPFTIEHADPAQGVIVATYGGDPQPYVSCGWIVLHGQGPISRISATDSEASFDRIAQGRQLEVGRALKLDGRLVVEVSPDGADTSIVRTYANYVLTKIVTATDRAGRARGRTHEVVSFSTGERGEFSKGTVCQPSGAFELAVMDALPPVTRIARSAPPAGPVPTRRATIIETELPYLEPEPAVPDCAGADEPYCEVLEITAPFREAGQGQGTGLEIDVLEPGSALLHGTSLGLDLRLPDYDAYLAVSFFRPDGTVQHLLTDTRQRWPANAREFLRDTGLDIAGPQRPEMVVVLASDVPLFASPRPRSEPVGRYLADLRARLAELSDREPAARIAASHLLVSAADPGPSS